MSNIAPEPEPARNPAVGWIAVALAITLGFAAIVAVPLIRSPGTTVQVEALWFGETADGGMVGGVTPVDITALTNSSDTPFSLDLSGIEIAGAGPMWTAATATAAAQAVLDSGVDPRIGELNYALTEAIDGPSAGALLTVGSIAAMNDEVLAGDITMTGTVLPDGSVGEVGGVPEKIRAAAQEGFTQVLVPVDSRSEFDAGSGGYLSPAAVGEEVGVEVTPVGSIRQAYDLMTRQDGVAEQIDGPPIDQSVLDLLSARSLELTASTKKQLSSKEAKSSAGRISKNVTNQILALLAQATTSRDAGDAVLAFSAAAEAAQMSAQEQAAIRVSGQVQMTSLPQAVDQVRESTRAAKKRIIDDLRTNSELPLTKVEQLPALADALAWGEFALTSMNVVLDRLDAVTSETELQGLVRFQETGKFESDTYMSTSVEAVKRVGNRPITDVNELVSLFDSYADLLDFASDANRTYAESLGYGARERGYLGGLIDEANALTDETEQDFPQLNSPTALVALRAGAGLQDYVNTTFLVDDLTVAGLATTPSAPNLQTIKDPDRQQQQARIADEIAKSQGAVLVAEGLDPSYASWMNQWGADLSLGRLAGSNDEQRLHGLDTQWFGVLQTRLLVGLDGVAGPE